MHQSGIKRKVLLAGMALGYAAGVVRRRAETVPDVVDDSRLGCLVGKPMTVITDDGVHLAVDVDEHPDPEVAVVFAHGWMMNRHCWHLQREAVAGRPATLVFYDQRGHGASSAGPIDDCTIDRLGDDLAAVIEQAVPEGVPVVLVGHSMGGMSIMAFAARHPELLASRVKGVALLSTSSGGLSRHAFGLPWPVGRIAGLITPIVFDGMLARADWIDRSVALKTHAHTPVARFMAFGGGARPDHVRFVTDIAAATPTEVMVGFFRGLRVHDKLAALAALRPIETLVMVGEDDRVTPPSHSRRIAESLPGARLTIVPGAGHMIGFERPDVVNEVLDDFLDRTARLASW
ncbi:alpha/beta fold hydrolase [Microtetraspora malaysiensis]|uniref:Alpha/beta fold hydrolase n=1 Tax=Microtetraspora malaysiensis TaxID=161358 RepID=A0ABW6SR28_9ACTN